MQETCRVKASSMFPPCPKPFPRGLANATTVCRQVIRTPASGRSLGRAGGSGGRRHDLVDAAPVHLGHLEAPAAPFEGVADDRDAAELRDDESACRPVLGLRLIGKLRRDPERALELSDG